METAGLIIALIAIIPIGYFLWDRYLVKPHKFEFDSENTFFARFVCPHNEKNGNIGLAFYVLTILNSSKQNLTIKEVLLRYTIDGAERSTESHVLITGTIYTPLNKKNVNAIIVKRGSDNIVLMDWDNLRTEIGKHIVLSPGKVLAGSALFVFDFNNLEEVSKMENVKVVVVDYRGKKSAHPISIKDEWSEFAKNDAVIENRGFTEGENGEIVFA